MIGVACALPSCCIGRLSFPSLLTVYITAVFNRQTLLPRQVLPLKLSCPGSYFLIEMKLQSALVLCDQPAAVSAKFTASMPSTAQLKTKEDTLAWSQTLTDRKPELLHNVKWAYKMPGKIAPRVDMPSNKQALGIKHFTCASLPLSLRPVVLNFPNSVTY